MASRQEVASLIVDFLTTSLKNNDIPVDNQDSIEFAIEGITEAFAVDNVDSVKAKFGNKSLSELLSKSSETSAATASESVPVHIDESDEKVKETAEALKLEGNKAMSQRDFQTAIAKYTEAINLIPTNAVYLSNRAAAYSSDRQHDLALLDAEKATEVEPTYAKAWSRLGLAKYALGDAEGSLKAYEQGLAVEGEKPTDAMTRGFETAQKKVQANLLKSMGGSSSDLAATPTADENAGANANAGAGAGAGGFPDLSAFANMMGGGDGAAGGLGGLAGLMNNPSIMQAAAQMMQDPNALSNLMNNPQLKQMASSMGLDSSSLDGMANNPMLQNMAKNFMGGNNNNDASDN